MNIHKNFTVNTTLIYYLLIYNASTINDKSIAALTVKIICMFIVYKQQDEIPKNNNYIFTFTLITNLIKVFPTNYTYIQCTLSQTSLQQIS
jgi:hypothetical protein